MSNVTIKRTDGAPSCELWDGRKSHGDDRKAPVPLVVTVAEAADLMQRDPTDWRVPAAGDLTLVNAEIKRRAAPAQAEPGGGN